MKESSPQDEKLLILEALSARLHGDVIPGQPAQLGGEDTGEDAVGERRQRVGRRRLVLCERHARREHQQQRCHGRDKQSAYPNH